MLSRRDVLALGVLGAPSILRRRYSLFARSQDEYSARAIGLLERSLVLDMLGLITLDWQKLDRWQRNPAAFLASDWTKLRSSGITAFHPAVELAGADPYASTTKWIAGWNRFLSKKRDQFLRIDSASDLVRAKREGRVGILLGLQNSEHFRTLDDICHFYSLGQRVSQLTYNSRNRIGFGCVEQRDLGLTAYGAEVIRGMNECGMAIDVSHAGERTTLGTFEASSSPVIVTHSNCRALVHGELRCKSDEEIRKMAAAGGVMGITGISPFVRSRDATIENVLDHYDHVARIAGVEHLGIGSDTDLDGRDHQPWRPHVLTKLDIRGLNHPRRVFDLTEGLIRRRYSDAAIEGILGANFARVLDRIWSQHKAC